MDLYSIKVRSTPEEFARVLLAQPAVFWSESEKIWVVTDHEMAVSILRSLDFSADRSSFFISRLGQCPFHKVANFFAVVKKMMVTSDPPEHTARRRLASMGISDQVLDVFQPTVESVTRHLVESLGTRATIDFVRELALPLPNIVLANLFSIPAEERADFYRWSNAMTQFFGGGGSDVTSEAENADLAATHLRDYFTELIAKRRVAPKKDFLSHLLANPGGLDDSELIAQAAIMLVAGTVTTTDQMCNVLQSLLEFEIWPKLVSAPDQIEAAIEEGTRLDPSVNFIFRVAKKDMILGGQKVLAGQLVFIASHAANRNAQVFPDPHRFMLARPRNPHLAYGSGIHYCLGARLGRIQMKSLFQALLERYPNLRAGREPARRKHQSLAFSGFETFPLDLASA